MNDVRVYVCHRYIFRKEQPLRSMNLMPNPMGSDRNPTRYYGIHRPRQTVRNFSNKLSLLRSVSVQSFKSKLGTEFSRCSQADHAFLLKNTVKIQYLSSTNPFQRIHSSLRPTLYAHTRDSKTISYCQFIVC